MTSARNQPVLKQSWDKRLNHINNAESSVNLVVGAREKEGARREAVKRLRVLMTLQFN